MKTSDFTKDEKVTYSETGEKGIVSSVNNKYVFVKFIKNGIMQSTAQACLPNQLTKGH